ncbi:MAG: N-acetylmuramoyl-L-alanine amidase [Lachnospiraceae bacterium]|nr:N-acetylmuramoyl-L-alanine amidase [Lachnospiraceae bacterium]
MKKGHIILITAAVACLIIIFAVLFPALSQKKDGGLSGISSVTGSADVTDRLSEGAAEPTATASSETTPGSGTDAGSAVEAGITPSPEAASEGVAEPTAEPTATPSPEPTAESTATPSPEPIAEPTATPSPEPTAEPTATPSPEPTAEPTVTPSPEPTADPTATPSPEPVQDSGEKDAQTGAGKLICIDPGHQTKGDYDTEPVAPGSKEKKAKVSSGTAGIATKLPEYKLNLTVSLMLRDALLEKGYRVIMTRETNDVKISNIERAQIANTSKADVFIRIHANGSDDQSVNGIETICPTKQNKYLSGIYKECKLLSDCVLDCMVEATGGKKRYVWETDTMSGINWSEVPVTIVEMGYMSNKEEDKKLSDESYQKKIVEGIVKGIDEYFERLGK